MDLFNDIEALMNKLNASLKQLRKTGAEYAKAYTDYRMALAKELLILKDEGYAISLAGDIARGKREIAHLKFEEISKEAIYKANQESINVLKLQIKILSTQLDKEYNADLPD